jgi:hypothetical protein
VTTKRGLQRHERAVRGRRLTHAHLRERAPRQMVGFLVPAEGLRDTSGRAIVQPPRDRPTNPPDHATEVRQEPVGGGELAAFGQHLHLP